MYENFRLEYQIVSLEFIHNKSLKIEAVCYNPFNTLDKEAVLKYSTTNLTLPDKRLEIAFLLMDSVIKNLDLTKSKLRKLVIKDHQAYYIMSL